MVLEIFKSDFEKIYTYNIPSAFACDYEITIDIQFCRMSDRSSRISGPASVLPNVGVVHVGYDQHAGPCSNHRGCDTWT